jgi:hypothetical protein
MKAHHNVVTAVAFDAPGLKLLSGSDDATIRVWELPHRVSSKSPPVEIVRIRHIKSTVGPAPRREQAREGALAKCDGRCGVGSHDRLHGRRRPRRGRAAGLTPHDMRARPVVPAGRIVRQVPWRCGLPTVARRWAQDGSVGESLMRDSSAVLRSRVPV